MAIGRVLVDLALVGDITGFVHTLDELADERHGVAKVLGNLESKLS